MTTTRLEPRTLQSKNQRSTDRAIKRVNPLANATVVACRSVAILSLLYNLYTLLQYHVEMTLPA